MASLDVAFSVFANNVGKPPVLVGVISIARLTPTVGVAVGPCVVATPVTGKTSWVCKTSLLVSAFSAYTPSIAVLQLSPVTVTSVCSRPFCPSFLCL